MAGSNIVLRDDQFRILQFRVAPASSPSAPTSHAASAAAIIPTALRPVPRTPESSATTTRRLFTYETMKDSGESKIMLLNDQHWDMPITEKPVLGSTEIWEFVNMTDDSHPIHLHLVKFQILDRRRFEPSDWSLHSTLRFTGSAVPPAPNELGWKDTVRADPHMVTRIIVRFDGWPGKYVWHCHILEHEDNEMMRPYEVLPA
jgi:spore coat protein A